MRGSKNQERTRTEKEKKKKKREGEKEERREEERRRRNGITFREKFLLIVEQPRSIMQQIRGETINNPAVLRGDMFA